MTKVKEKALFECKISCSDPTLIDDVIYVLAFDIQDAIQAAVAQARKTSGKGARVVWSKELAETVVQGE